MGGSTLMARMKTASSSTRKMLGQMTSMKSFSDHAQARARDVLAGGLPTRFKVPLVKGAAEALQPCIEGGGRNADSRLLARVKAIQKIMRPGDIVTTDPRQPVFHRKIFKALSKQIQKSRFGHSAMYVGDGNVVESRDVTVVKRPLLDVARCNDFLVHRVDASKAQRDAAAAWVKKHIGNDKLRVTVRSLLRRGVLPTAIAGEHEQERVKKMDQAICSSLIANAYPKVPFNKQRAIMNTRPSDIIGSEHVRLIGKIAAAR